MEQVTNGGDLMVFLRGNTLAFATSHKLTINVETVETTSKDNGGKWVSKAARKISWSVSSENLFIEKGNITNALRAFGDLYDLMVARQAVNISFCKAKNAGADEIPEGGWIEDTTGIYSGLAIITSLEANAPNGDNATFSITFEGVGPLIHAPKVAAAAVTENK